jgi:ribonuclease HI
MSNYKYVYCDGGVYDDDQLVKWAFLVVKDKTVIHKECGTVPYSGNHNANVENAEAEAISRAVDWCFENSGNYVLYTDSRSMLDKIHKNVSNATKQPLVNHIRRSVDAIKSSVLPISIDLKYKRRRSDEFSKIVDDLCQKT